MERLLHQSNLDIVRTPSSENPHLGELLAPSDTIQHPNLHLVNTRVWLREQQEKYGKHLRLTELPDVALNELTGNHDAVWFMGIYPPSKRSEQVARTYCHEYADQFPGMEPETDVVASPFAIPEYTPSPDIALNWDDWDQNIYQRLQKQGKKVFLDFVGNHVAYEHRWTTEHPQRLLSAPVEQVAQVDGLQFSPVTFTNGHGPERFAHGKDPWCWPPWIDTLQLNYANPDLQKAQIRTMMELSKHADGLRCDMAHLTLPNKFIENWSWLLSKEQCEWLSKNPFWPRAIDMLQQKMKYEGREPFILLAEAYADEDIRDLIQSGFTGAYEKEGLYRRLIEGRKKGFVNDWVRGHVAYLTERVDYAPVIFTENHDEPRAVKAFGGVEQSLAAAAISGFIPNGIFMTHQGQEEGRKIKLPMQVNITPGDEEPNYGVKAFYDRLLRLRNSRLFQQGRGSIPDHSHLDPSIIAQQIESEYGAGAVVCTNYSNDFAQGAVPVSSNCEVAVYNLMKDQWLPRDKIAQPYEGMQYVQPRPWETEILYYWQK